MNFKLFFLVFLFLIYQSMDANADAKAEDNLAPSKTPRIDFFLKSIELNQKIQKAMEGEYTAGRKRASMGLTVHDFNGNLIYNNQRGRVLSINNSNQMALLPLTEEQPVPVASATKLVVAYAMLKAVDLGFVDLDSTTGDLLGWRSEYQDIKLRDLLSFTSGLPPSIEDLMKSLDSATVARLENRGLGNCLTEVNTTLYSCAQRLHRTVLAIKRIKPELEELNLLPGERFDYSQINMSIAGAMVEVAVNRHFGLSLWSSNRIKFADLYLHLVKIPLKFEHPSEVYTNMVTNKGLDNPRMGGGLVISTSDYNKVLNAMITQSHFHNTYLLDEMVQNQVPWFAKMGKSPYNLVLKNFPYGFGNWIECRRWDLKCHQTPIVSSGGAFGYYPWIDFKNEYYSVISTLDYINPIASLDSFLIAEKLRPTIIELIRLHQQIN